MKLAVDSRTAARVRRLAWCLCALLALSASGRALAQAGESEATRAASARALFDDGVKLADQGQWKGAADRFGRALALHDSPVIAYNLASALQELGRLVEASELLRRVQAHPEADADLHKSAQSALAAIEPRLARITLHAQGRKPDDVIAIDGRTLLAAQLDVAIPIDPGSHVASAKRGGQLLDRQPFELADGGSSELSLQLTSAPSPEQVAAAAPKPTPAASSAPAQERARDRPLTAQWPFWAAVGAVAAGAVVTTVLLAGGGSSKPTPAAGDFMPPVIHVEVAR